MHSRQTTGTATNSYSTIALEPRSSTPSTGAYTTEVSPRRLRMREATPHLVASPVSRNNSSSIPYVHKDTVDAARSPQRHDFTTSTLTQAPSNTSLLDSLLNEVESVLDNPQDPLPYPSSRSRPSTALAASRNASTRTHLRPQTPSSSHDLYSTLADLGYGAISPSVTPTSTSNVPAYVPDAASPQIRPNAARLSSVDGCDVDSLIAHVYPRASSAGAATTSLHSTAAVHGAHANNAHAVSSSHTDALESSDGSTSVSPAQAWGSFVAADGSGASVVLDGISRGNSGSRCDGDRRDGVSGSDSSSGVRDAASNSWAAESLVKPDGICSSPSAAHGNAGADSGGCGTEPQSRTASAGADACMLAAIHGADVSAGGTDDSCGDCVAEVEHEGHDGEWEDSEECEAEDDEGDGERDALSVADQTKFSVDTASSSTRRRVRARKRVTFATGASAVATLSATDTLDSTTLTATAATTNARVDSGTSESVDAADRETVAPAGAAVAVAAASHANAAMADTAPHALIATVQSLPVLPLVPHVHTPLALLARNLPLLPSPEVTLAPSCAQRYRPVRRLGQGAFGSVFLLAERVAEEEAYVGSAASIALSGADAGDVIMTASAEEVSGAVPSQPQLHPSLLADASLGYLLRDVDGCVWRCSAVLKRVVVEEECPVSFTHSAMSPADNPAVGSGGDAGAAADSGVSEAMQRALAEVQLMQSLQHPFVVHIHTHLVWRGCVDMVIEWARGGDLEREIRSAAAQEERWSGWYKEQRRKDKDKSDAAAAQIAKSDGSTPALPAPAVGGTETAATNVVAAAPQPPRGRISEERVCGWLAQIALAVYFIHSRRVLHRDIKTANIFLTADGDAKLGDFGAARALATSHDKAKTQIGTPYYLAPEICHGRPYGPACDVWSLGVVAYELCALKRPFVGGNIAILVMAIVGKDPAPLPKHYSAALRGLIARMLEKEPDKRANMEEVISHPVLRPQLHRILGIVPSPTPHTPTPKPARRKASAKDATVSGGSNASGHTAGARVVRKKNKAEAKVDDGDKGKKKKKKKAKRRSNRTGTLTATAIVSPAALPATPSGEVPPPRAVRQKVRADVDGAAAKAEGTSAPKRTKRTGTGPVDGVVKKKKKMKKKASAAAASDAVVDTGAAPAAQSCPTRTPTASGRTPRTHVPTPSSAHTPASARTPLVPAPPSTPAPTRSRPVSARYVAAEAPTPSRHASADAHGHGTATPSRPLPRLRPSAAASAGGAPNGGPGGASLPRVLRPPPRDSAHAPAAPVVLAHPRTRAVRGGGVTGTGSVRVVATQSHSPTRDTRKPPVPSHVIGAGRAKAKVGSGATSKAKTATVSREPVRGDAHAITPAPSAQPLIAPLPPAAPPSSRPTSAATGTSRAARMQARVFAEPPSKTSDSASPDARTTTPVSTIPPAAPVDSTSATDPKSAPASAATEALRSASISPALSHTFAPALAAALGAVSATAAAGTDAAANAAKDAAIAGEAEGRWLGSSVVVDARALAYIQAIARELKNTGVSVLGKWRRSRERRKAQQSGESGEGAEVGDGAGAQSGDGVSSPSTPTRNNTAVAASPSLVSASAAAALAPTAAASLAPTSPGLPRSCPVSTPAATPNQLSQGVGPGVGTAPAEAVTSPATANTTRGHAAGSADALGVTGVPEAIDLSQTALALNKGLGGGYGGEEVEEALAATLDGAEDDEDAFIAQHARKAVAAAVAVAAAEEEEEEEEEGAYSEDWGDEDEEDEEDAESDENDEDDEDEDEYSDDYESDVDDEESEEFSYDDDDEDNEDEDEEEEPSEEDDDNDDSDDEDDEEEEEEGEPEGEEGAEVPEVDDGEDEDFDEVEEEAG